MNYFSFKSFRNALFIALALTQVAIQSPAATDSSAQLSASTLDALKVIASRKGLTRLDYNEETKQWSLFDSNLVSTMLRALSSKNRFDTIVPLEELVGQVEEGALSSVTKDPELYYLLRRAYTSMSSLYSYYKINPSKDMPKQVDFIGRFGAVLARYKAILVDIESKVPMGKLYKVIPGFGDLGSDLLSRDAQIGLKYLDMGAKELAGLNQELLKNGNDDTRIDRAMAFFPMQERKTLFKSSLSDTSTKKFAIFIVHGTFAAGSPEYTSDKNILFQQTKYMAQSIANDQNVPVEVYSFGWSGRNDNEVRMDAGEELANFVRTYFPEDEYYDIYVGHSHGGNVVLHMAKTLREYRTPHMIITLATPIRKDFITDNVNYLFEFYTESDWVQFYGSYEMTRRNATSTGTHAQNPRMVLRDDIEKLGLFAHNDRYNKVKIYATKVLLNFKNPNGPLKSHSDLKYLIGTLPRVLDTLIEYKPNGTFTLNIDIDESAKLTVNQMENLKFQIVRTQATQ